MTGVRRVGRTSCTYGETGRGQADKSTCSIEAEKNSFADSSRLLSHLRVKVRVSTLELRFLQPLRAVFLKPVDHAAVEV